jgi:hypothetical protein
MSDESNGAVSRGAGAPRGRSTTTAGSASDSNPQQDHQRMSLNEALERIISSGRVGQWMTTADGYLRAPSGVPDVDSLPKAHRLLAPVIERCRASDRALLRLLESLRASPQGAADDQLGMLIEQVNQRIAQADRKRARSRRAAAILIRADARGGRVSLRGSVVEPTARQIEQAWDAGLVKTLRGVCHVHPRRALDLHEMEQLHTEFWAFVEDEVTNGRVPLWGAQINIPREHS